MDDRDKQLIDKLSIISEMSECPACKQMAKVIIKYLEDNKDSELGFKGKY